MKSENAQLEQFKRKASPNLPKLNISQDDQELSLRHPQQISNERSNKSPMPTDLSKGQKTPQIPNLDLEKIHSNNNSRKADINIKGKEKKTPDIVIDETDKKVDRKA